MCLSAHLKEIGSDDQIPNKNFKYLIGTRWRTLNVSNEVYVQELHALRLYMVEEPFYFLTFLSIPRNFIFLYI